MIQLTGFLCVTALPLTMLPGASAQEKYKRFEDARAAGGRMLRDQQFADAQEPLEAALRMAPDDKARLEVYQLLSNVYRLLPDIDKKLEASEFVIRHSPRQAARSLASRDLASFLNQRGKVDLAIERYESLLKEKPDDLAALSVLTVIYSRLRRDADKSNELAPRLEAAERQVASRHAEQLEKDAESAPRLAAGYLKDAAAFWLEAGDKTKALAAARKSAASLPESRSELLVFYWHDGLGDVFLATGEPKLAIEQFEAALAATKIPTQRTTAEKKLATAKAALEQP